MTHTSKEKSSRSESSDAQAPDVAIAGEQLDPVCSMTVHPETARAEFTFEQTTYYFCSQGCATKFSTSPSTYLIPKPEADVGTLLTEVARKAPQSEQESQGAHGDCCSVTTAVPAQSSVKSAAHQTHSLPTDLSSSRLAREDNTYTCPMHPEVMKDGPGDCPICGMLLERLTPGPVDESSAGMRGVAQRFTVSVLLAIPVAFLSMADMTSHSRHVVVSTGLPVITSGWLQFILSTPVVLWAAKPFFERGWSSVKNRSLNMFTLLSLGIGLPYIYSLVSLISVSSKSSSHSLEQSLYFESAVVIATLAWLGQLLEAKARVRSSSAVRELIELMPTEAIVILHDGTEKTVPVSSIAVNAKVRVKPGERVPVDGVTINGASSVNESMLTGEVMPVEKIIGSHVSAGTINGNGTLVIEAKRLGSATTLSQIVDMVSQAQRSRMPVQQLADRVAAVFVPVVLLVSVLTAVTWYAVGEGFTHGLSSALAVLVVACPCALGLATPMSIIVAAGRAARAGVLFKEARSLQLLASVNTLVIDKTGTLTVGAPLLVQTHSKGSMSVEKLITLVAALESCSEHPLACAIVAASKDLKSPEVSTCTDFASTPGGGVQGTVSGHKVIVGTPAFLQQSGVECDPGTSESTSDAVVTSVFVAIDGVYQAQLDFADELRDDAANSVKELSSRGLRVVMATGDSEEAATKVASALGIADYHARLLPADKAALVKKLQQGGARVAMAGDGINDAPSLMQADVGISLASGTDIAVHSSDIVLVNNDIQSIIKAQKVSQAMIENIKQNLVLAFAYNMIAIPIATGILIPVVGFTLDPMVAAGAMSVSSVAVIANALRLRRLKL